MGARQVSPRREQDVRDKPPQPPLPFARKGRAGTRCGTGQDTRRGTAWGKARATPLPPSHRGPHTQRQWGRDGPPPGLRAGRRERARLHTLSAAPPFACGQRANGGGARSNLERRPFSPGWRAGATREPERAQAAPLPWNPSPRVRAQGRE
ncbi:hypothetical protein EDB84DRAFT_1564499 [Lactarius hengduanensis]|nr:hypothetical protein EDB84DRAFT_1564499 [Lactarius hengduanensis]